MIPLIARFPVAPSQPIRIAAMLLCLLALAGCGRTARDLALDKEAARQSLTAFLDCWKEGKTVDTLQAREPPITGRDTDWDNGLKLTDYKIVSELEDGTNAMIATELTLTGQSAPRKVTYVVGTSPVITIFRDE